MLLLKTLKKNLLKNIRIHIVLKNKLASIKISETRIMGAWCWICTGLSTLNTPGLISLNFGFRIL